ncbi:hypothetical protein [Amycolatopsis taiwanensis]|uniref:hypothetical protein n=1 Tax=Amycolatopsis taiwanensis TaxID=342230 RepID=UPI0004BA34F5|nr:hypothetical protein [Amycolatopsis taiwanensis]
MIRRLVERLREWSIAWLVGDGSTWLTDEYAALLDEQDRGGEFTPVMDSPTSERKTIG